MEDLKFNQNVIDDIEEEDIPNIISKQLSDIQKIDIKIKEAEEMCKTAKKNADEMKKLKFGQNSSAINTIQDAVRSIVVAQESFSEAQKLLFENQHKMAQGMRYLLVLGTINISMGRRVVKELELKLKYASKEEISREVKEELINVIKLLKEQENAFSKQDKMEEFLDSTHSIVESNTKKINYIESVNEEQTQKDIEHDNLIGENKRKNDYQDTMLKKLHEVDIAHKKRINRANRFAVFAFIFALMNMGLVFLGIILGIIGIVVK